MAEMISFFILLFAALFFPMVLRKFHIPWVAALIVAGILIGPSLLGYINPDAPVISFLADIGVVFLMFMAGLETGFSRLKTTGRESLFIAVANGFIPFLTGFAITLLFGYGHAAALLIGLVFTSSSVAVVLPALEARNLMDARAGITVIGSTMIQDLSSLVLIGLLIHQTAPQTPLPLPLFAILLIASFFIFKRLLPSIKQSLKSSNEGFETELRTVLFLLVGVVVFYEIIGLHPIVSGFFSGLFLADIINEERILSKIHAMGYGLFIPIFFIVAGASADISLFMESTALLLTVTLVAGTMTAKYVSGYLASQAMRFTSVESSIIGATSIPQLSTSLAVAVLGVEIGLLDTNLLTAVIALSIITTVAGPFLVTQTLNLFNTSHIEGQTTLTTWCAHDEEQEHTA